MPANKQNTETHFHKREKKVKIRSNIHSGIFWIKLGISLTLLGILCFSVFVFSVWTGGFGKLPSRINLSNIEQNTASEVYSADGELMGRYFIENRLTIGNKDISTHVINALIATEDSRFFEHRGIDPISLGRVLYKTILIGNKSQGGGSTISQQLARNLYPRDGNSWWSLVVSKTKEVIIANRLEKIYTKDQVLNLYLNTVPFGEEIYGIETASQRFFSKHAGDLNPAEAANLIGMLAANTAYNPRINPEKSLARRNMVLHRMGEQGFLPAAEILKWSESQINLKYRRIDHNTGIAPYFRDYLKIKIEKILNTRHDDSIHLFTDGLQIYTTIDSRLQYYAEESVKQHMRRLQKEFNLHWQDKSPWEDTTGLFIKTVRKSSRYRQLIQKGLNESEILILLKQPISALPGNQGGEKNIMLSPLDSIRQDLLTLHTGFLAMDPFSGYILAWVGGINHEFFKYDHVTAKRQTGSTFKPIVYSTALENGMEPCDFILNERKVYNDFDGWSPANSDENYEGYYSLKGGLVHSVNTITAEVIMQTGIDNVIELTKNMGISADIPRVPSIALGSAEISLFEMLNAYTTFLRYGVPVEPIGLQLIKDRSGNILYKHEPSEEQHPVIDGETSLIMVHMLKEVVDSGTARSLRSVYNLKGDLAGKTGTTQNNADGWFIGFTPRLLAGCWVGAENPSVHFRTTDLGQGAYTALPIFARFIQKLEHDQRFQEYTSGSFPLLPAHLERKLDCVDYSFENPKMNFFKRLFRFEPRNDSIRVKKREERLHKRQQRKEKKTKEGSGFKKTLNKLFGSKNKTEPPDSTHDY